eukprot:TRINITY_DN11399_c0_g1_i1.p2 TRINITY_DN11399_c0_g1~~TRINITY_DN11399_c0_g1_i1.p2  ORF type:complete len:184 (+),score=54.86 TRINITY_DN11399_c0_g1_i1:68-619(+)
MARRSSLLSVALLACVGASAIVGFCGTSFLSGAAPGRREALQGLAGAAAATFGAQAAWADAYGSKPWALSKYAPRIIALKDEVEQGNLKNLLDREGTFKALNGYWMFSPELYGKKNALVDNLFDAAEQGDKAKVKELYTEYLSDEVLTQWQSIKPRKQGHIMNVASALMTGQNTYASQDGRGI